MLPGESMTIVESQRVTTSSSLLRKTSRCAQLHYYAIYTIVYNYATPLLRKTFRCAQSALYAIYTIVYNYATPLLRNCFTAQQSSFITLIGLQRSNCGSHIANIDSLGLTTGSKYNGSFQ